MSVYSFLVEKDSAIIVDYVNSINKRLADENFVRNPFSGFVFIVSRERFDVVVLFVKHLYPNVFSLLWFDRFLFLLQFRRGLRNVGYKGRISLFSVSQTANFVCEDLWVKQKS